MVERIKLQGVKELDKVFRQLPKKIGRRVLTNASAAAGRIVLPEAKRLAPVSKKAYWRYPKGGARVWQEPGELRDSIIVRRDPRRPGLVIVGPKWPEGAHGHLLEFGTAQGAAPHPFLRPAFDAVKGAALAKMGDSLGRAVERAAVKLVGSFATSGAGTGLRRRFKAPNRTGR